ncbi:MAG: hypothetical protein J1D77_01240 [Muribaculaceae bacterium]|nr:hypothetical protein [Muribaculaceae bacterium]
MRKYLTQILPLILTLLAFASCNDEFQQSQGSPSRPSTEELPVDFNLSLPDDIGTRDFFVIDEVKRVFTVDDVIHILGTFNVSYLDENGVTQNEVVKRYGALRFDGRQWNAVDGSTLTWPSTATDGQFIAYYLSESNGVLTTDNPSARYLLSGLTPMTDPLYALSASGINYGFAVSLNFNHICTYLTLVNMEPLVSDSYWFSSSGVKDPTTMAAMNFNNAFEIRMGTDSDNQPTLNFEFLQVPNPQYANGVFIEGRPYTETDPEGNPIGDTQVSYFLQPAYYNSFNIEYPATAPTTYPYLIYDYDNIPPQVGGDGVINNEPNLQAGITYTLDITKSPGITINTPPPGSSWDESDDYFDVEVEDFLKAATQGGDYTYTDPETGAETLILEKTPMGSRLLRNVDFKNFNYSAFEDAGFQPDLDNSLVFDGGLHYIRNLADPLFRENKGSILNLGLKSVDATIISYESNDEKLDNSRNGALCHFNQGKINNVRLINVALKVYVKGLSSSETHNVGGVVGSNTGSINEVTLSGTFSINVTGLTVNNPDGIESDTDYPVNVDVLIGGVSGQNAGILSEVTTENPFSVTIVNTCQGPQGGYSIGGIAGESSGYISEVNLPSLSIDSTGSEGQVSNIGGMVGLMTSESSSSLTGSNAGGIVRAGVVKPYGYVTSLSYTGGMVGGVVNGIIDNCIATVSVYGPTSGEADINATGGLIGRIESSSSYNFSKLVGWGDVLSGPSEYRGNFVGAAPNEEAWKEWMSQFNVWNINVRDFGYDNVGGLILPTTP